MVFGNYAKYYNLLYTDKDYTAESDYIIKLLKIYAGKAESILDIGCGTGKHAALISQRGYHVTGVDLSGEMITIAQSKKYENCVFKVANARNFELKLEYDVITSLFHVMSYQTSNEALEDVFKNVTRHLKPEGIFIFDFWYTPAVLTQKPSVRIKRLEDDDIKVTRLSEPVHKFNENIIDVNFELHIHNKHNGEFEKINELHKMRYFSIPELEFFMNKSGLKALHYEEWMTGKSPSEETWGVCCIARKIA